MKDLTGKRFGRLEALAPTSVRWRTSVMWRCRCDCGQECLVPSSWLLSGDKRSCGCLQDEARRTDITGQARGQLEAIRPTVQRRDGDTVWVWRCSCGAEVLKTPGMVGPGKSTMCPACARRLKAEQAAAMAEHLNRDPETGVSAAQLRDIRQGRLTKRNTSGVRGVSWRTKEKKWCARISDGKRTVMIGYYDTIEEAAEARRLAVLKRYGEDPGK